MKFLGGPPSLPYQIWCLLMPLTFVSLFVEHNNHSALDISTFSAGDILFLYNVQRLRISEVENLCPKLESNRRGGIQHLSICVSRQTR